MTEEIKVAIVLEMMGRPAEHLKQVMEDLLKKLVDEKGITVLNKKIHEPTIVEQKDKEGNIIQQPEGKELYSTFSEVEIEAKTIMDFVRIIFTFMPSHIEILSPNKLSLDNFDLSTILSEITRKLHQYDAIAKNAMMQNQILVSKLQEIQTMIKEGRIDELTSAPQPDKKDSKKANKKAKTSKKKK
jgi:hypothetical protein